MIYTTLESEADLDTLERRGVNLGNIVEAALGPDADRGRYPALLQAEGEAVLRELVAVIQRRGKQSLVREAREDAGDEE